MTKGQDTQEAIVEAAFRLFVSQGYHGTSMRQIAEASGLQPASLYNHFDGKEQIFIAIINKHHPYHEILPILESAQGEDAEELFRDVATRAYNVVRQNQEILHLLFIEMVEFDGRHFGHLFNQLSPRIFPFLNKLRKARGSLRRINPANMLLSIMGLVMSQWILEAVFLRNIKLPGTSKHFEDALEIYLHGVLLPTPEAPNG
jgi:AcrR family transcriptional regulator